MTARPLPDAPSDLSEDARQQWPGLAADVVVVAGGSVTDFDLLAEVLRVGDRLAEVRAELSGVVTIKGSTGQTRAHPLLAVESALARRINDGYAALRLTTDKRPYNVTVGPNGRLKRT